MQPHTPPRIPALIASGLYSGFTPFASGTFGSLACIIFWFLLSLLGVIPTIQAQIIAATLVCLVGLIATRLCIKELSPELSSRGYMKIDPSFVVIDEWVGMLLCLCGLVPGQLLQIFVAFLLFRLFDVLKPGPVRWVERLPGEWGIMLDDVLAGALALGCRVLLCG